jgi:hypothetical protein
MRFIFLTFQSDCKPLATEGGQSDLNPHSFKVTRKWPGRCHETLPMIHTQRLDITIPTAGVVSRKGLNSLQLLTHYLKSISAIALCRENRQLKILCANVNMICKT